MLFAAAGYPPMTAERRIPPQCSGIRKSLVAGRRIIPKKSAAALLQMKTESAINGKSAGITEYEQTESPFRIPSPRSADLKRSIAPRTVASSAVRKFRFVKKTSPSFSKSGTAPLLIERLCCDIIIL